jgi:putative ABC transport system permease protein
VRRNALRSFLTLLGIVIGVAAVIAMITIGSGTTEKVKQDIGKLGSNLLMVRASRPIGRADVNFTPRALDESDLEALAERAGGREGRLGGIAADRARGLWRREHPCR